MSTVEQGNVIDDFSYMHSNVIAMEPLDTDAYIISILRSFITNKQRVTD